MATWRISPKPSKVKQPFTMFIDTAGQNFKQSPSGPPVSVLQHPRWNHLKAVYSPTWWPVLAVSSGPIHRVSPHGQFGLPQNTVAGSPRRVFRAREGDGVREREAEELAPSLGPRAPGRWVASLLLEQSQREGDMDPTIGGRDVEVTR